MATEGEGLNLKEIGFLKSVFQQKTGTPRQGSVCKNSRGSLTIDSNVFNNPEHSLAGLEEYSHIWIMFIFHLNKHDSTKAKVKVPRLDGAKKGVFSCRTPYRPSPIGLTLAKIEAIEGATIHVSGIDIVDGTPVLDIKPYVAAYDMPKDSPSDAGDSPPLSLKGDKPCNILTDSAGVKRSDKRVYAADWLAKCDNDSQLKVEFTDKSLRQLALFHSDGAGDSAYKLQFLQNTSEAQQAITDVLIGDPRSAYRRKSCADRLYYFICDSMHITCWFDETIAEVLKIQPVSFVNLEHIRNKGCE